MILQRVDRKANRGWTEFTAVWRNGRRAGFKSPFLTESRFESLDGHLWLGGGMAYTAVLKAAAHTGVSVRVRPWLLWYQIYDLMVEWQTREF